MSLLLDCDGRALGAFLHFSTGLAHLHGLRCEIQYRPSTDNLAPVAARRHLWATEKLASEP